MPVQLIRRTLGLLFMGAIPREVAPQYDRLTAEPVYPEDEIEHRSHERDEPDEAYPSDGCARIPLIQGGVPGGRHRSQQHHSGKNNVPGLVGAVLYFVFGVN